MNKIDIFEDEVLCHKNYIEDIDTGRMADFRDIDMNGVTLRFSELKGMRVKQSQAVNFLKALGVELLNG
jgi:hypothetical protein